MRKNAKLNVSIENKALMASALIIIGFSACKKGKEDPFISFRSRDKRIEGTWKVNSYKINGQDMFNGVGSNPKVTLKNMELKFGSSSYLETYSFEECYSYSYYSYSYTYCDSYSGTDAGTWSFTNKKKSIDITINSGNTTETESFDLIGLSNSSLHMEGTFDIDGDGSPDNVEISATKK